MDLFTSFNSGICSTVAFPPLKNSDHVVVSVSIDFSSNSKEDVLFYHTGYDYSHVDWDNLHNHTRDIFKHVVSAATEFCEWVQIGIDVYIPHCKYQFKPHSSS